MLTQNSETSSPISRRPLEITKRSSCPDLFTVLRYMVGQKTLIVIPGNYHHITKKSTINEQTLMSNVDRRGNVYAIITHAERFNLNLRFIDLNVVRVKDQRIGSLRALNILADATLNMSEIRAFLTQKEFRFFRKRNLLVEKGRHRNNQMYTIDLHRCKYFTHVALAQIDTRIYSRNKRAVIDLVEERKWLKKEGRALAKTLWLEQRQRNRGRDQFRSRRNNSAHRQSSGKNRRGWFTFSEPVTGRKFRDEIQAHNIEIRIYELVDYRPSVFRTDYEASLTGLQAMRDRWRETSRLLNIARLESRVTEYAIWEHESPVEAAKWAARKVKRTVWEYRTLSSGLIVRRRVRTKRFAR